MARDQVACILFSHLFPTEILILISRQLVYHASALGEGIMLRFQMVGGRQNDGKGSAFDTRQAN